MISHGSRPSTRVSPSLCRRLGVSLRLLLCILDLSLLQHGLFLLCLRALRSLDFSSPQHRLPQARSADGIPRRWPHHCICS